TLSSGASVRCPAPCADCKHGHGFATHLEKLSIDLAPDGVATRVGRHRQAFDTAGKLAEFRVVSPHRARGTGTAGSSTKSQGVQTTREEAGHGHQKRART